MSQPQPVELAQCLARPVTRGLMSREQAVMTLIAHITRGQREGFLQGNGDLVDHLHIAEHILDAHIERQSMQRAITENHIKRTIQPLIERASPSNRILAEAHSINGDDQFPFFEHEVTEIAATEVQWSMRRRPQHVRG